MPKCSKCLNHCTIVLISHAGKVMLKILQVGLQQYVNWEIPDVQVGFRKGREARDQIANIHWIIEKPREFQKMSMLASLTMLKPLIVWLTTNWKILQEMGIPDHLTCLLRNLYAVQEVTVRTGHGTTDCFQTGKGVCQGCILSPCLSNLLQSTSWEMLGWMKESRLPGEISITSDTQMTPLLWHKVKRN